MLSLLYLALSLFGLGLLVFVHEWGHYYVGLKMGMKVETFSIGFGKPIKTWTSKEGVVFQIGSIPFGGFVKFKGLDGDRSASDSFYRSPFYKRIFVAFAGPLANIILAFMVFSLIYIVGGRSLEFTEKNPFVGLLKESGIYYSAGLREGDRIKQINDRPYMSFNDFMIEKMTTKPPLNFKAERFPLYEGKGYEFSAQDGGFYPASYVLFHEIPSIVPTEMAYLAKMGLEKGDRLLSINAMPIFSKEALVAFLQKPSALIHVKRQGIVIPLCVTKLNPSEINFNSKERGELTDWMHSASLKEVKYYIPYNLTSDLVVENACEYLNENASWQLPSTDEINPYLAALEIGDQIIAVNGNLISSGQELVSYLDKDEFHIVAQKRSAQKMAISEAIEDFWAPYLAQEYAQLLQSPDLRRQVDFIQFSVPAIKLDMLKLSSEEKQRQEKIYQESKEQIQKIKDPAVRAQYLKGLEDEKKRFMIGGKFSDQIVKFNPSPFAEMADACKMTFKTLASLINGGLAPKHLSGPVAIVGVMKHGAQKSLTEGLYYFAVVSINLALFNLLPLPVLDGGHILFALYEGIFRRPVPQKIVEKLTLVFVVLLVSLIVYATYNDILRFIKGFF